MSYCGDGYCGECGKPCHVNAEVISFDYAGTHCTGGKPGTHIEGTDFLSECCDAEAFTNEELTINFDRDDCLEPEPQYDTYDEYHGLT